MSRMIPSIPARPVLTAALTVAVLAIMAAPTVHAATNDPDLPRTDRYLLSEWVGYSPPQFSDDLQWHGDEVPNAPDWWSFHDRVVVVQSFTHTDDDSVRRLGQVASRMKNYSPFDVQLIALHTPAGAENFDERRSRQIRKALPEGALIVIDPNGLYCDQLGIFEHPANLILNRDGVVTHVGLTPRGARDTVERLLDFEEEVQPVAYDRDADFPTPTGSVGRSRDMRGQEAPDFYVQQYVNWEPNCEGKLKFVEFWRTGCPHCINAIPKLNELAEKYAADMCMIGITSENEGALHSGLQRRGHSISDFKFSIAIDTSRRMTNAMGIRGVPHAYIVCSDGIVRWQGHPNNLTEPTLEQIIAANRRLDIEPTRDRWKKKLASSE